VLHRHPCSQKGKGEVAVTKRRRRMTDYKLGFIKGKRVVYLPFVCVQIKHKMAKTKQNPKEKGQKEIPRGKSGLSRRSRKRDNTWTVKHHFLISLDK
jgi:hypothetical protein